MSNIVFVTGATSGFGKAIAEIYAKNNFKVIINGRRTKRLNEIKNDLEKKYNAQIYTLPFDVRDKVAVFDAVASLPKEWKDIEILINNAGLALGTNPVCDCDLEDWETMIDTNIKGLLYVTKAVLPTLISKKSGHIVNLGSTASKECYPGGNVYCATKHSVEALTKTMRIDLIKYGIRVSQISPGMSETEFSLVRYKGDKNAAVNVYKGVDPLTAEDIAQIAYFITVSVPKHVCIRDIIVSPQQQANSYVVCRNQE